METTEAIVGPFVIALHLHCQASSLSVVVLDQGVGQQLVGGLLEDDFGLLAVETIELDIEHLALTYARNPAQAQ